jgi:4'-phosphopantetheinyl transferase
MGDGALSAPQIADHARQFRRGDSARDPIDITCIRGNVLRDPERLAAWHDMLTYEEYERMTRYRRVEDARLFAAGRATLRTALAARLGCAPRLVPLAVDAKGRPVLSPATHPSLGFSVSHCDDFVAVAVCARGAVGIDVERLRPGFPYHETAKHIFPHLPEARTATHRATFNRRFVEHWVVCEAYAKALGLGLSLPFDQIAAVFDSEAGRSDAVIPAMARRSAGRCEWSVALYRPEAGVRLAVCTERSSAARFSENGRSETTACSPALVARGRITHRDAA